MITEPARKTATRTAKSSTAGVVIVAALGVGVWWIPNFSSFLLFPPLLLGVGVGIVARYSGSQPGVLVTTAAVTTAVLFSVLVLRYSSFGVHGDAMGVVIAAGVLVVVEATLAAGAGAVLGRMRRNSAAANPSA
jgi:hypothetical protein